MKYTQCHAANALRLNSMLASSVESAHYAVDYYPNPSNGSINILLPGNQECGLELFNLNGQLVFSAYLIGAQTLLIPEQVADGAYFIKFIEVDDSYSIKQLIISRE